MLTGGEWLIVIAGAIIFAVVFLVAMFATLPRLLDKLAHRRYVREAKAHNQKARALRLAATHFQRLPLPEGNYGELRITREDFVSLPTRIDYAAYMRAVEHRAEDLWVVLEWQEDKFTGDTVIKWRPRKEGRPRETY